MIISSNREENASLSKGQRNTERTTRDLIRNLRMSKLAFAEVSGQGRCYRGSDPNKSLLETVATGTHRSSNRRRYTVAVHLLGCPRVQGLPFPPAMASGEKERRGRELPGSEKATTVGACAHSGSGSIVESRCKSKLFQTTLSDEIPGGPTAGLLRTFKQNTTRPRLSRQSREC